MNRNENETESFAGNFAASEQQRLFFEVPIRLLLAQRWQAYHRPRFRYTGPYFPFFFVCPSKSWTARRLPVRR
jgi:hypothetical protein